MKTENTVELSFRKKGKLRNIVGIITAEKVTNAVELKKKSQKGQTHKEN